MTEEIMNVEKNVACECEGDSCSHKSEVSQPDNMWTKHRGSEEMALALLLVITPLVVLTFFGQVGLL